MDIVTSVRGALAAGASTRKEIAAVTGLDSGLVDATVDVLLRTGALDVHELKFECGAGGCRNCAQDAGCTPRPQVAGPVPVPLTRPPRSSGDPA